MKNRYRGIQRTGLQKSLLLFLLFPILLTGCSNQVPPKADLTRFTDYLNTSVPRLAEHYKVPGLGIAIIVEGKPVWTGYYGYANSARNIPITSDTVYRTQSISKSVTAWGVMKLVEQGKVTLDTPITEYLSSWQLPPLPYDPKTITLRRLLSHTAGMQLGTIGLRYDPNEDIPTLREALKTEVKQIHEPGETFSYSNVGYNLMELIIEEITGESFAAFMKREILVPLGMQKASFLWNADIQKHLAAGYTIEGAEVAPYIYSDTASGGLFSNLEELALFVSAGMQGKSAADEQILSPKELGLLYTPAAPITGIFSAVSDAYGFGHFIEVLPGGETAVWHGGQGYGWMTHFHSIPETGDGIVILTNSQRSWPLIARILRSWTDWRVLGPVQMSRITYGVRLMWAVTVLLAVIACILSYRLLRGLLLHTRVFAPFSPKNRYYRLGKLVFGITATAGVLWASAQPYLMLTSVFPGVSAWAALALAVLGVVSGISSAFPSRSSAAAAQRQ